MVQDEDTQPLETPIIAPVKAKKCALLSILSLSSHAHTYTHTHTHTYTRNALSSPYPPYLLTLSHIHTHTYTHTHIRTYIYTHIHSSIPHRFALIEKEMPETTFSFRFLAGLMDHPTLARHVAFLGNLHCGKTSVVDIFVQQTHMKEWDFSVQTRYTDIRVDEQERGVSVKAMPMSMVDRKSVV